MRKLKAQNLIEFGLILALVVVFAVISLSILGSNIKNTYRISKKSYKTYKPFDWNKNTATNQSNSGNNNTSNAGPLGGTPEQPVSKCSNGTCSIDFGEYMLDGIPENFSDFVESASTSGGTQSLAFLLEQIADQLEAEGKPAEAQQFRDLANLGHYTGMLENQIETIAENDPECTTMSSYCYTSLYDYSANKPPEIPANIANLITDPDDHLEIAGGQNRLDLAANAYFENPDTFNDLKDSYPAYKMYELYQNIQSNPAISDNLKSTATEILTQMSDLKANMTPIAYYPGMMGNMVNKYDLETGAFVEKLQTSSATPALDDLIHPQFSTNTHLRSALVCTTGKFDDTGKACN